MTHAGPRLILPPGFHPSATGVALVVMGEELHFPATDGTGFQNGVPLDLSVKLHSVLTVLVVVAHIVITEVVIKHTHIVYIIADFIKLSSPIWGGGTARAKIFVEAVPP